MRVTVLGAGSWGTTVASLISRRNDVLIWARSGSVAAEINESHTHDRYLSGFGLSPLLRATDDLEKAVRHAQVLVVGVPSDAFRPTIEFARAYLHPWIPVVSLSKGLERDSLLRMTQVIKEVLPGHPAAALTGPNLAKEIMAGMAAASVIATEDLTVAAALQVFFSRGLMRVYTNHDVIGCEIGGAMKNVVAIATGMAQSLGVGDNTRATVISRGLAELTHLGVAMGAAPLGAEKKIQEVLADMGQVAEGVKTVHAANELADRYNRAMPITRAMYGVITDRLTAAEAYTGLMRSPAAHAADPG
jgi:glycerol-3-phosphate dehydrogenase (NAD(P)+)